MKINQIALRWQIVVLAVCVFGSLLFLLAKPPFGQDLAYHQFSDSRVFFGIPNFFDVLSNLPFLLVGVSGIRLCWRRQDLLLRSAWLIFFTGVTAVSVGSAYYHWSPDNLSLVWDRLPMTVGFMGLFVALLAEYVNVQIARSLLLPALLVGMVSVWYWYQFDDLRIYYWVQLTPMLVLPLLMLLFKPRYSHHALLLVTLTCYLLAKYFEHHDAAVFALTDQTVSGHSIKHLLAASACYVVVLMLRKRRLVSDL